MAQEGNGGTNNFASPLGSESDEELRAEFEDPEKRRKFAS